MNRLRLKLVGLVVLVLAVIFGVYSLWPGESLSAEQVEKQEETVSRLFVQEVEGGVQDNGEG